MRLLIIYFLIPTLSCMCQNFNAGFIGGINMSQISGDGYAGYNKIGMNFGSYVILPNLKGENNTKSNNFIKIEMLYSQKGSFENDLNFYKYKLNYISIPILYLRELSKKIEIESGLSSNFLVKFYESEKNDNPNFFNIDYILGFVKLLNKNYKINFRFNHSITPVREHNSKQKQFFNRGEYSNFISILLYKII
ncbi:MAG: hypothetical protein CBE48_001505 [Flavobacteriales bacterium TMED288]|nr:MAG: hypothetical protein CBE48_001505 [Flavobacteriales bacterium TMED288]